MVLASQPLGISHSNRLRQMLSAIVLQFSYHTLDTFFCFHPYSSPTRKRIVWAINYFTWSFYLDFVTIVILGMCFIIALAFPLSLVGLHCQHRFSITSLMVRSDDVLVDVNYFFSALAHSVMTSLLPPVQSGLESVLWDWTFDVATRKTQAYLRQQKLLHMRYR